MHDFSIGLTRWVPDYADAQSYLDTFTEGTSMNFGNYASEAFNTVMTNGTSGKDAADADKRFEDMVEAEKILIGEDHAMIPLYQEGGAVLINPNVTGYIPLVLGTGAWRHMHKA